MFSFNAILTCAQINVAEVSLMLHNTTAQPLRAMLPSLAQEKRHIFEAYQRVHSDQASAALRNRPYVAIFIPFGDGRFLFEGFYSVVDSEMRPTREIYADPAYHEIAHSYGDPESDPKRNIQRRDTQEVFHFFLEEQLVGMRGRIVVRSPGGRNYVRVAANTPLDILEISETHQLLAPTPPWRDFIVSAGFLRSIPRTWADSLCQWRGIYLITDQSDGCRYVGSAYGEQNLLGRWQTHVRNDRGVTRELAHRDPAQFQFSILERVSSDASVNEVTSLEHNWMKRLDTVRNGLNT